VGIVRDSETSITDETVTAEAAQTSDAARTALAQRDELANGFRFRPAGGRYVMRDYDPESLPRLQAAYRHLSILVTDYPDLVPGQLNRLVHQWRSDMWRGITAKTGAATDGADGPADPADDPGQDQADEQPAPADRYIEIRAEFE
jgi:hypothetical protein